MSDSRAVTEWRNCYNDSWQGVIVPDAFAHPAKFARGLIRRIYQHMIDSGYIAAGDSVIDPFGGVGLGGLDAMTFGLHYVGCELEPRFVDLGSGYDCPGFTRADWRRFHHRAARVNYSTYPGGSFHWCPMCQRALTDKPQRGHMPSQEAHRYQGNIDKWRRDLAMLNGRLGTARLLQGDSRRLVDVVGGGVAGVVSSPPFQDQYPAHDDADKYKGFEHVGSVRAGATGYRYADNTPGQLGSMPPGSFDSAVSSPPYSDMIDGQGEGPGARYDPIYHNGDNAYKQSSANGYGTTPGNLGSMAGEGFEAAVSSPPYEGQPVANYDGSMGDMWRETGQTPRQRSGGTLPAEQYNITNDANIANDTGDTFWAAARVIVEQTYQALRPGGYAAWVCKDFVRKGQRVPFSDQWQALCEAVGFEPVERIAALLVEDHGDQLDIFGGMTTRRKERKSFFRRLAEKNGSPRIDHEDVIIMRKPQ